jgi:CRP-like cAMP-binding protein
MNIREIQFFNEIETDVVREIENSCTIEAFGKDSIIFNKGSRADFLYILDEGNISLLVKDKGMTICNLTEPGEVFGWSAIVEQGIYTASSVCTSETRVLKISREKIEDIFNRYPKAAVTFYRRLGSLYSKRMSKALEETL